METTLSASEHFIFITLTSLLSMAGGLLLWIGFAAMALLSRRYERTFGKTSHWQFLLVAPVGLCAYLLMQSVASLRHENMGPFEQWTGYTLLSWSALLCFWGVWKFRTVLQQLAKEE